MTQIRNLPNSSMKMAIELSLHHSIKVTQPVLKYALHEQRPIDVCVWSREDSPSHLNILPVTHRIDACRI